jgi:hypothetical protein
MAGDTLLSIGAPSKSPLGVAVKSPLGVRALVGIGCENDRCGKVFPTLYQINIGDNSIPGNVPFRTTSDTGPQVVPGINNWEIFNGFQFFPSILIPGWDMHYYDRKGIEQQKYWWDPTSNTFIELFGGPQQMYNGCNFGSIIGFPHTGGVIPPDGYYTSAGFWRAFSFADGSSFPQSLYHPLSDKNLTRLTLTWKPFGFSGPELAFVYTVAKLPCTDGGILVLDPSKSVLPVLSTDDDPLYPYITSYPTSIPFSVASSGVCPGPKTTRKIYFGAIGSVQEFGVGPIGFPDNPPTGDAFELEQLWHTIPNYGGPFNYWNSYVLYPLAGTTKLWRGWWNNFVGGNFGGAISNNQKPWQMTYHLQDMGSGIWRVTLETGININSPPEPATIFLQFEGVPISPSGGDMTSPSKMKILPLTFAGPVWHTLGVVDQAPKWVKVW